GNRVVHSCSSLVLKFFLWAVSKKAAVSGRFRGSPGRTHLPRGVLSRTGKQAAWRERRPPPSGRKRCFSSGSDHSATVWTVFSSHTLSVVLAVLMYAVSRMA